MICNPVGEPQFDSVAGNEVKMSNYEVRFNDDRSPKMFREINHLEGGYIRCSSPTVDSVETKRYPPTVVKEIVEL